MSDALIANATPRVRDVLQAMRAEPSTALVASDFDGTLAPIVAVPSEARPLPRVVDRLDRLAAVYGLVAVVTGRPQSSLRRLLPTGESVLLCGSYGRQFVQGGRSWDHPETAKHLGPLDAAAATAVDLLHRLPSGTTLERKDVSFVIHYRGVEHPGDRLRDIDDAVIDLARSSGLVAHLGKKSVEVVPPDGVTKGSTVRELVRDRRLERGVFFGDDLGDLAAFESLREMRAFGFEGVAVAVESSEMPDDVRAAADLVVPGPEAVAELLGALLPGPSLPPVTTGL